MSNNPFSSQPTIVEEVDEDDTDEVEQNDEIEPAEVKEDYDEVPNENAEVRDDDGDADEEWAQTPTNLFAALDQEKFWWVFVSYDEDVTVSGDYRPIPVVEERFDSYKDLVTARDDTEKNIPEGIHVQLKESNKIRYVKGQDEENLLERRGLA